MLRDSKELLRIKIEEFSRSAHSLRPISTWIITTQLAAEAGMVPHFSAISVGIIISVIGLERKTI